jgi:hypothetical membrane protein
MGLIVLGVLLAAAGLVVAAIKAAPPVIDMQRCGRIVFYSGLAIALLGVLEELATPG